MTERIEAMRTAFGLAFRHFGLPLPLRATGIKIKSKIKIKKKAAQFHGRVRHNLGAPYSRRCG